MEYVVVGVVVAILLVSGIVAYVVPRRRRPEPPVEGRPDVGFAPGVDDPAAVETARRVPDTIAEPDDTLVEGAELLPAPPERPEPAAGRLVRLRSRLARSQSTFGRGLLGLLSRERIDDDTWQEIEDTLLTADLGVAPSQELVDRLRTRVRVEGLADPGAARAVLREELVALVDPSQDRSLRVDRHVDENRPAVVLVVGVNGTGKTTTVGKLARVLVAEDRDVVLGAADTFRAAASDQLTTWGDRVGVPTVRGPEG
ncbi:MAG: signal recognition particle receptor subunit alpha, partial [Acidimicrobiales bacterium]